MSTYKKNLTFHSFQLNFHIRESVPKNNREASSDKNICANRLISQKFLTSQNCEFYKSNCLIILSANKILSNDWKSKIKITGINVV